MPKCCESKNSTESPYDSDLKDAWNHCKKWSKSIEVLYKSEDKDEKVLAKVHFRTYPSVSDIYTIR